MRLFHCWKPVQQRGAFGAGVLLFLALCPMASSHAQSGGLRPSPFPSGALIDVQPSSAAAGELIEIQLTPFTGRSDLMEGVEVSFNELWANVTGLSVTDQNLILRVRVPSKAQPQTYSVVVAWKGVRSRPYEGFVVTNPGFWKWLSSPWGWVLGILGAVMVFFGVFFIIRQQRVASIRAEQAERTLEHLRLQIERTRAEVPASEALDGKGTWQAPPAVPDVPPELVEACATDSCVLFTGAGIAVQAGFPTTSEILGHLLERAPTEKMIGLQREILAALRAGRYAEVSEVLAPGLPRETIVEVVRDCFPREPPPLPKVYESLRRIPFVGAISNSWDALVERTFRPRDPVIFYPTRSEPLALGALEDAFFIAKPYGCVYEPDTFLFTPEESQHAIRSNRTFSRLLATLAGTRSVLFVGASLDTIQGFLSSLQLRMDPALQHFALVQRGADWSLQEELFASKFGVRLLGYVPSAGFPEVEQFLTALADKVEEVRPSTYKSTIGKATLSEVKFENIGPFKKLTLKLNPQWNILLGNNGTGKSTLLRAIALGLCGDDEEAARGAERLLRAGEFAGVIELKVGDTVYRTHLARDGEKVRVESKQFTPLQKGSWVVLGFPPLRGVSTRDPEGPKKVSAPVPVVEDLLPLIRGAADERLNNLKQWIVNLDAGTRSKDPEEAARYRRLRDSFFELLRKVTPGVRLEYGEVRLGTWQVLVKTDDGMVSIDQVSQGMSSILGWVGTMLQRMYEIHAASAHPESEPALVLVDEIEAHLHPEWQQRIVGIIRESFPNLQIIATSHSPLLVAGMKASEVFIARRDFDNLLQVEVGPAPIEFEGLRADQILTGPLFGLATTRGDQTRQEMRLYSALRAKEIRAKEDSNQPPLTAEEEQTLAKLREKLLNVLWPEESRVEQLAADAVSQTLRKMADPAEMAKHLPEGQLSTEMKDALRRRLETILPSVSEDKDDPHRQERA